MPKGFKFRNNQFMNDLLPQQHYLRILTRACKEEWQSWSLDPTLAGVEEDLGLTAHVPQGLHMCVLRSFLVIPMVSVMCYSRLD